MYIKIHKAYRTIVAIADSELIGKKFEEGNRQIEVKASFFTGEEKNKEEIIKILKDMNKEDANFNIVGKESIEAALEAQIINKSGIIIIQGVPIALVLL